MANGTVPPKFDNRIVGWAVWSRYYSSRGFPAGTDEAITGVQFKTNQTATLLVLAQVDSWKF
jgi:hypothetical protein